MRVPPAPFGETYAATGSTGVTDISFAGNNEDTTTNLYDAQFREYGIQGRWPSPDPSGIAAANPANPQSWNRYAYVLNNPLLFVDPAGLREHPEYYEADLDARVLSGNLLSCDYQPGQDCMVLGNDIFDAIAGTPGTYLQQNMYGDLSFGWDYSLYSLTMNEVDALNSGLSPAGFLSSPDISGHVSSTTGWNVFVEDLGTGATTSGVLPDLLSAYQALATDRYFWNQAMVRQIEFGNNEAKVQQWEKFLQYDVTIYSQALNNLFNLIQYSH